MKLAKEYGIKVKTDIPDDPGPLGYIWGWFTELHNDRPFDGMSGVHLPIPPTYITAWQELTGITLAAHEYAAIKEMDGIFIAAERKAASKRNKQK